MSATELVKIIKNLPPEQQAEVEALLAGLTNGLKSGHEPAKDALKLNRQILNDWPTSTSDDKNFSTGKKLKVRAFGGGKGIFENVAEDFDAPMTDFYDID